MGRGSLPIGTGSLGKMLSASHRALLAPSRAAIWAELSSSGLAARNSRGGVAGWPLGLRMLTQPPCPSDFYHWFLRMTQYN